MCLLILLEQFIVRCCGWLSAVCFQLRVELLRTLCLCEVKISTWTLKLKSQLYICFCFLKFCECGANASNHFCVAKF